MVQRKEQDQPADERLLPEILSACSGSAGAAGSKKLSGSFLLRAQPVDATDWLNLSAGVS
jgi:hypothetical protein